VAFDGVLHPYGCGPEDLVRAWYLGRVGGKPAEDQVSCLPRLEVLARYEKRDNPIRLADFGLPLRVIIAQAVNKDYEEIRAPEGAAAQRVELPGGGQLCLHGLRLHLKAQRDAGAIALHAGEGLRLNRPGGEDAPKAPSHHYEDKTHKYRTPSEVGYLGYGVALLSLSRGSFRLMPVVSRVALSPRPHGSRYLTRRGHLLRPRFWLPIRGAAAIRQELV
jgi:hypothetical protein